MQVECLGEGAVCVFEENAPFFSPRSCSKPLRAKFTTCGHLNVFNWLAVLQETSFPKKCQDLLGTSGGIEKTIYFLKINK